MNQMKRLISCLLAICLFAALIPVTALADELPAIDLNNEPIATIAKGGDVALFRFTPAETGEYTFSSSAKSDTYGCIYDADMNLLTWDDDSGEGDNFELVWTMDAGVTYILSARFYSATQIGQIPLKLVMGCRHTYASVVTAPGCTDDGYTTYTCNLCGESYTDSYTDALGHNFGADACSVCGTVISPISHNITAIAAIAGKGDMAYFRFIPAVTADYAFYSSGKTDACGYIFDADMNELATDDDGGANGDFSITYSMEANTAYILAVRFHDYNATGQIPVRVLMAGQDPIADLRIVTQPASYIGAVNDEVTFSLEAAGEGLTYEWFYSNTGGDIWVKSYAPGYQTSTLNPILRGYRDGNLYKCIVTDVMGSRVESDVVSMTVKSDEIVIHCPPEDIHNAVLNQLYHFSVAAEGTNLTYRWEFSDDGGETWQLSWNQGYNSDILNVRMNANRDGNLYCCVITSGEKIVAVTDPAVLNLQKPSVSIVSQSGSIFATTDETATFTVEAEGMDLTYLWYRSNDKGATWIQTYLSGYNTDTLSFSANANRAAMFMCKVTDGSGKAVWSDPVKLQILSAELKILTQPVSVTCANGETAAFTVDAQGDTLRYQWYYSADGEKWTMSYLTGYNTNTFSFAVNESRAAKMYKCIITDAAGSTVETDTVTVTIR